MAEIVGLTASIVAITGAAGTALKVSGYMMGLAKQLSAAEEDIEDFATKLEVFHLTVDSSVSCLHRYSKVPALQQSPTLKKLLNAGGFELLEKQSKRTKRRIQEAWKSAQDVKSQAFILKNAFTALNWVVYKPQLLAVLHDLQDFKSDIALLIVSLALEMKLDSLNELEDFQGQIPESVLQDKLAEIAELKDQIRVHVKTIALSQENKERQRQRQSRNSRTSEERYERSETLQDILIDVGSSAMEHEQGPWSSGLSPSSLSATSSARRKSYASATSLSTAPSTAPANNSASSIPQSEPNRRESPTSPTTLLPKPLQLRTDQSQNTSKRTATIQPQQSTQAPSLRRRQRRITSSTSRIDPATPVSRNAAKIPSPNKEIDSPAINRSPNFLHLVSTKRVVESTSGYIATKDGSVHTTAILGPVCPQNIISVAQAASLGLIIEPHGATNRERVEQVIIRFPNGQEKVSSGVVTFQWSAGMSSHKPPFNVRCLVYEHDIGKLMLGQPFIDSKTRYWKNRVEDDNGGEWMR